MSALFVLALAPTVLLAAIWVELRRISRPEAGAPLAINTDDETSIRTSQDD